MQGKGVTLLFGDLQGKKGDTFKLRLAGFNSTVRNVQGGIKAIEVGKKTNIIRASFSDNDPVLAQNIVNTLVQAYLDKTIALNSEEASRTVSFVEDQLKDVRQELDKAEADLQAYKASSGVMQLDAEALQLITKITETEKDRAEAMLQRKQLEFSLASLKDAVRRGAVYSPAVTANESLVGGMAGKLADLEVQKKALLAESTKNHPAVRTTQAQIDELQRKIQSTYETGIMNLARQESNIAARLAVYEGKLKLLPAAERDLARHMRLTKVNADIYTFLLQKHEEARIAKASTISNINIIDPAITPDRPVKPQKGKNLLLGLLIGCMLGLGLAFFREYLDDTLKDAEEIKRFLGIPLSASSPTSPQGGELEDGPAPSLITYHEPKSANSEAFRSLRTALHFSGAGRASKCILVDQCVSGGGEIDDLVQPGHHPGADR